MAWEERGEHRYYYRKKREGDRVVTEYIGAGEIAHIIADTEQSHKRLHALMRVQAQAEQAAERAQDAALDALDTQVHDLAAAALLLAGCHTHRGQWRKRR